MSPMALLTLRTPAILNELPIGTITPYFWTILWYSSILFGVCSEVSSSTWLFLIKIAEESPKLPTISLLFMTKAARQVVPSCKLLSAAFVRNSVSSSL